MLQRKSVTNCILPFAISSACALQLDCCVMASAPQLYYNLLSIPELFFPPP